MSTKIDDLPGPAFNEIPTEIQNELYQLQQTNATEIQDIPSNVTVNLKKRVHFADEIEELQLSSLLNEDNLFFFVFLFIATLPSLSKYVHKIPIIGSYASGDMMTGVIKAAVLFVLFLYAKTYILPKIKF
jgi:hypothetical protein